MNKIKEILNQYFWLLVIGLLVAIAVFVFWFAGAFQTARFDNRIDHQMQEANKAVREAVNAQSEAINFDTERQTEDTRRTQIIKPKLDELRTRSKNSKAALDAARKTYNEQKSNIANLSNSHADNCRKLGELFSNVKFDDCR